MSGSERVSAERWSPRPSSSSSRNPRISAQVCHCSRFTGESGDTTRPSASADKLAPGKGIGVQLVLGRHDAETLAKALASLGADLLAERERRN